VDQELLLIQQISHRNNSRVLVICHRPRIHIQTRSAIACPIETEIEADSDSHMRDATSIVNLSIRHIAKIIIVAVIKMIRIRIRIRIQNQDNIICQIATDSQCLLMHHQKAEAAE
jgi:hypothetical protein